jgi:SAM-dependent methyltransferase
MTVQQTLPVRDEIAAVNQRHWEWAARKEAGCTIPWLDLDIDLLRRCVRGEQQPVPTRLVDMVRTLSGPLEEIEGKDVLCLAAGGGQQSAVFGLLGAHVTVVDLCDSQLEADRKAGVHYGYQVTTVRGDMRDLSCLEDESFDLVYGTGMCFVPDARQVYAGVARILRPQGLYRVDFCNPAREFVDEASWDGGGYRITVPYYVKQTTVSYGAGSEPSIQFRHYMDEVFNGLLDLGFSIQRVFDNGPREQLDATLEPGSWEHSSAFLPGSFAVVAVKR